MTEPDWDEILARFEAHAHRCPPAYAARVRAHLAARLGLDTIDLEPDPVFLEEDPELLEEPSLFEDPEPLEERRALLIIGEGLPDERVVLLERDLQVGRGRATDVQLAGDTKISRFHCTFEQRDGVWWVRDLDAANGTLVNGELLDRGAERRLFGGEELIIGETFLRFRVR